MMPDDELGDEPIPVEITDVLDLHTFAPRDVGRVVRAYLEAAVEQGIPEVRLIHGKGKGVQREHVRRILSEHPAVLEHFDGTPQRGGWGATIARLRTTV